MKDNISQTRNTGALMPPWERETERETERVSVHPGLLGRWWPPLPALRAERKWRRGPAPSTRGRHKLGPQGNHSAWTLDVSSSSCLSFSVILDFIVVVNIILRREEGGRERERGSDGWTCQDVKHVRQAVQVPEWMWMTRGDAPLREKRTQLTRKGSQRVKTREGFSKAKNIAWPLSFLPPFLTLWPGTKGPSAK